MKKIIFYFLCVATIGLMFSSCTSVEYKRTKSGLLYKIIPGKGGDDSLAKTGEWLKLYFTQKLNDSVMQTNYGKMPVYAKVAESNNAYNPAEVFTMLHNGDSVVTVVLIDSLLGKKLIQDPLPAFMKKGDRISTAFRIVGIFKSDSLYQVDYMAEAKRDEPRQKKENEEKMAQMQKQAMAKRDADMMAVEQSGEAEKARQAMQAYLASKSITAQKTGHGTFVHIDEQGSGTQAAVGKFVTVKYTGKILTTDSAFQSNEYTFELGKGRVIAGWDEGMQLFKVGGKGTLYIPGFLAYGKDPQPGSPFKPNDALKFDVELKAVSDTMPAPKAPPGQ